MKATLYHNPSCSKSRQALTLLTEQGIDIELRDYRRIPPQHAELVDLMTRLKRPAHDLLRSRESEYAAAGLSPTASDEAIFAAITAYPKLLERPIVVTVNGARIGRPTDAILEVL
ncbi:arsenate reductase (glutaredoxin) [Reinekea sp.]|jgi:arsenate reductase|uniref:arsenate reductase (glutaredoxin) n=1 Tax=Reinekea sp. TaxID=1970455 RepID=UPI002A82416D|nr:arsenate reductase (glutaredoxin) [Reinekea sp.]